MTSEFLFDLFSKVEKSVSKTFGALCCESGPLSMDYVLNKNGFVCGEKIKINIKVNPPVSSFFLMKYIVF